MAEHQYSFEEIDQRIKAANLADFEPGGKHHFTAEAVAAAPGDVLQKICSIYRAVRPILVVISNLPLIPPAWRKALKTFISLMDTLCPGG